MSISNSSKLSLYLDTAELTCRMLQDEKPPAEISLKRTSYYTAIEYVNNMWKKRQLRFIMQCKINNALLITCQTLHTF